jgi:chromodomain-helicase-DNA-binding protein 4
MIVNISNKRATVNIKSARSMPSDHEMEVVPDSEQDEDEDEDDNDGSDDEYDEDGSPVKSRRITRSTVKPVKNLPFSPRKTRSQKVFTIPDSDDEDVEDREAQERGPTRRSTRTRKSVKVNLDTDAYLDESEPEGGQSDGYSTRRSKPKGKKPKKVIRGKASRPAYGHFRVVADLDYDPHSDEDSAPLREHRKICEKCHRGPAHELLEAAMKKPKGRRKKKTSDDEFEESGDEQEKLIALGGWVRW